MCLSNNLRREEFNQSVDMQSTLMRIISHVPFELFSASDSIIFTDREGLESAAGLIEKIGHD